MLRTGAPWADIPRRYPLYSTCYRRFKRWVQEGVLERLLHGLAEDLKRRGKLDLTEAYVDGSHPGQKGGPLVGLTRRGSATNLLTRAIQSQDLRKLRHRYKRRWLVERLFAWLMRSRRLVTRYETKAEMFLAFLRLACARLLWRRS